MACSRRSARPRTRSSASSAPREHEPATAAELQLLRESVEEAARCNAVTEADAAAGAAGAGVLGTTAESGPPPAAAAPLSAAVAASTRWNCHPGTRRLSRRRADLCKFGLSCAKEARRALLAQTQAGAADVVQVAVRIQLK